MGVGDLLSKAVEGADGWVGFFALVIGILDGILRILEWRRKRKEERER
jgi:hypothetical protein